MPCDCKAQVLWDEFMANTVTLTSKNSKNFRGTFRLSPQRWGACLHQWCRWPPGGICRLQPCMARCYSWTFWAPSHSRWDQNLQLKQPRHPVFKCWELRAIPVGSSSVCESTTSHATKSAYSLESWYEILYVAECNCLDDSSHETSKAPRTEPTASPSCCEGVNKNATL